MKLQYYKIEIVSLDVKEWVVKGNAGSLWRPSQEFTWGLWGFSLDILEKSRLEENN